MFALQSINVTEWTPEVLILIWGVAQSLFFEYVPRVKDLYGKLDAQWKRLVQAFGLLLVSFLVLVLACTDVIGGITCDQAGAIDLFIVWIFGLMANQTTHLVFKKKSA